MVPLFFYMKVNIFVYCQSFWFTEPDSKLGRIKNCQELQEQPKNLKLTKDNLKKSQFSHFK
jgi:hypothetical protein